ncbi:hypothetical protein G6L37_03915 [Agrobacterium rubi]|nr:hypothetical protein [Agrobacterium rubi]NTF24496.1 hypothetical protein [Agrobacterium rubi]
MAEVEDPVVGKVRTFRDTWRGRAALCLLVGEGSGPQDEAVRIVGKPVRGGGFTVNWVISYDPGSGNARRAYEFLVREYGGDIRAMEVRSETGIGFHQAMKDLGLVSVIEIDGTDDTPSRMSR